MTKFKITIVLLLLLLYFTGPSYSAPPRYIYNADYTIKTDTRTGIDYPRTNLQTRATARNISYIYTFADRKRTTIKGTAIATAYAIDYSAKDVTYRLSTGVLTFETFARTKTVDKTKSNRYNVTYYYNDRSKTTLTGNPTATNFDDKFSQKTVTYDVDGEDVNRTFNKTKTSSKWDKNNLRYNNTYFYNDRSKSTSTSRLNNFVNWDALGATYKVGGSNQTTFYLPFTENSVSELVTFTGDFSEVSDLAWYQEVRNNRHIYTGLSSSSMAKTTIYNKAAAIDNSYLNADLILFSDSRNTAWGTNANGYAIVGDGNEELQFVAYGIWLFSSNCPIRGCAKNFGNINGYIGGGAFGYETPAASVPTTGSKRFTGDTIGAYVDENGISYFVSSNFTADTNFATREIDISAYNTSARNLITDRTESNTNLNWSGSMNYAAGSNSLSGTGVTDDGNLSGDLKGKFYGGAANEIGGTWTFTGAGGKRYGGSFAGK